MTSSAKHSHSIYIDAPLDTVFTYMADPAHIIEAMPEDFDPVLGEVNYFPDGDVASYECKYRELGLHLTALFTREEFVRDERILDHSSMGVDFIFTVEPAPTGTEGSTGTTLTYAWDATGLMKLIDAAFFHGDTYVQPALERWKAEIEKLT